MSGNDKPNTDMIPQSSVLRVCMSCWSRLPGVFRISQGALSTGISSRFTCSQKCGLRWLSLSASSQNTSSDRMFSNEAKPKATETSSIENNPYFARYRDKLKKKESESPDEFNAKLNELQEQEKERLQKRKEDLTSAPTTSTSPNTTTYSSDLSGSWPPKSLNDVMKIDLIKDKTPAEIDRIWKEYYLQTDCVFAVIKGEDYDDFIQKSKVCPLFIYPLPRADGFEFIFAQFSGKDVYFTPLQMYQTHKENAPVCLTVAHFPELKEEKGLVLMAGKYDDNILSKKEALSLVRQMSEYYGQESKNRFRFVQYFNNKPEQFNHNNLINEYNEMKKSLDSEY